MINDYKPQTFATVLLRRDNTDNNSGNNTDHGVDKYSSRLQQCSVHIEARELKIKKQQIERKAKGGVGRKPGVHEVGNSYFATNPRATIARVMLSLFASAARDIMFYDVRMVSTFSRVWINRTWSPILLVVS